MEDIKKFINKNFNSNYRYDLGSGYGFSKGNGFSGDILDSYVNDEDGYGGGSGDGSGYDDGSGDGSGYNGDYSPDPRGIIKIDGHEIYMIDDVLTIIFRCKETVAKGAILKADLTLEPCYIAKVNGYFAHGRTVREAMRDAVNKSFQDMDEEERIAAFMAEHKFGEEYPANDFFEWHNRLTGSCEMGRRKFAEEHGINLEKDTMTIEEFIKLTEGAYGGEIIRKLKEKTKWILI